MTKQAARDVLAERLRAARAIRRLDMTAVAGAVGVARSTVMRWERGQGCPEAHLVPALAAVLGITPGQMLGTEPFLASSQGAP